MAPRSPSHRGWASTPRRYCGSMGMRRTRSPISPAVGWWRWPARRADALVRLRHVVEEAGDHGQPVVGRDDAEVGARHHGITAFRREIPGEAHPVVVALDIAGATEAMARKALLHTDDH